MAVKINPSNVSIGLTNTVVIKSAELVNTLIARRDDVIKLLSDQVSPVTLADIQVDEHGTVIISNAAFKDKIADKLEGVGPLSNGTCGVAC